MADYDVGAVSLSVPPASAVIQPYRPAVLVRNNGVHDALAVGSLRIYGPAGLLVYTSALYSGVIAPGETDPAQAENYWTPPELGRYQVIAHVSCINDQVSTNDNLAPCFVNVIEGEPEPPSPVTPHASQHEEGGTDELLVDGLHGRLTDAQTPLGHKASHQVAGSDALDVTGLLGILGQGQTIADHHATHEDAGGDEMNVDDLHGVLYNLQKPKVHANEAHDPNYAITPHGNEAHDPDYQRSDEKDQEFGYCGLDTNARVDPERLGGPPTTAGLFLRGDQTWASAASSTPDRMRAIAILHEDDFHPLARASTTILLLAVFPANTLHAGDTISIDGFMYFRTAVIPAYPAIVIHWKENGYPRTEITRITCTAPTPPYPEYLYIHYHFDIYICAHNGGVKLVTIGKATQSLEAAVLPDMSDHNTPIAYAVFDADNSLDVVVTVVIPDAADALGQHGPLDIRLCGAPLP